MLNGPKFIRNVVMPIPGFSRYTITVCGKVYDTLKKKPIVGNRLSHGYYAFYIVDDDGRRRHLSRHRALMLTFQYPTGYDPDLLEVNHKNRIKGDDRFDNLEWTTRSGNMKSAVELGWKPTPVKIAVRDVDTGDVTKFPSKIEAARSLNLSKDQMDDRLINGEKIVYPERKQYRRGHDDLPWYIPSPEEIAKSVHSRSKGKRVLVRNVLTDTVKEFATLGELARHLGVVPAVITRYLSCPPMSVFPGFVQVKYTHDPTPWEEVEDPIVALAATTGHVPVQRITAKTGDVTVYLSTKECADENNLLISTLNWRLKSAGKIVYEDGYRYGYYPNLNQSLSCLPSQ